MAFQDPERLSSGNIPHACRLVIAPRDNPLAIRRKADRKYRSLVAVEGLSMGAAPGIPKPHRAIFTAGDDALSIGRKGHRKYGIGLFNKR
jgi:hypothetical protein